MVEVRADLPCCSPSLSCAKGAQDGGARSPEPRCLPRQHSDIDGVRRASRTRICQPPGQMLKGDDGAGVALGMRSVVSLPLLTAAGAMVVLPQMFPKSVQDIYWGTRSPSTAVNNEEVRYSSTSTTVGRLLLGWKGLSDIAEHAALLQTCHDAGVQCAPHIRHRDPDSSTMSRRDCMYSSCRPTAMECLPQMHHRHTVDLRPCLYPGAPGYASEDCRIWPTP
ncbi:hypothetical protein C8Q77DRAFT_237968 [Trametes polyzona]|nr:hypothetical protein C8Q77DRAFT_237968 [Trametes polyzona]